ncbi:MAG TPA: hypothetical protein VJV78_45060, partial [Polyangiales bacterium]|nr:hypothetical protein [Polyangiales bacterium]
VGSSGAQGISTAGTSPLSPQAGGSPTGPVMIQRPSDGGCMTAGPGQGKGDVGLAGLGLGFGLVLLRRSRRRRTAV